MWVQNAELRDLFDCMKLKDGADASFSRGRVRRAGRVASVDAITCFQDASVAEVALQPKFRSVRVCACVRCEVPRKELAQRKHAAKK